ncbi:MAG: signal peptidase I [Sulfurimonas sp.]
MKKFFSGLYNFSSTWTGTIIIVLFLIFFVAQSFVIPSGSMKRTQLIGDFLFAKKFSYGIPTPHLPWLEIPILPDYNNNGHLIEGPRPQREEIVIFRKPQTPKVHFVKRCIAVGGDEILYMDRRLLIHFHDLTTEAEIKEQYPEAKILRLRNKLWVENPYMNKYPGIQYVPENYSAFEYLAMLHNNRQAIDMHAVYLDEIKENAFYKKVEEDHYYMIGDNRDNSSDSRMWGSVPYRYIVGKPWLIYMSLEFRSYKQVHEGDTYGNGKDNARLGRVCGEIDLGSPECEALWNRQRYTVRWGRIGRRIDTIQYEEPIE